jgi:MFS family permease
VKTAPGFPRLAWSNLAAQSAEQIGLAATPLVAVLALGAGAGETGFLQTVQTLPFLILAIPAGLLADRDAGARAERAPPTLVVAAAGFLVQAVVILVSPVRCLARQPRMAA